MIRIASGRRLKNVTVKSTTSRLPAYASAISTSYFREMSHQPETWRMQKKALENIHRILREQALRDAGNVRGQIEWLNANRRAVGLKISPPGTTAV
jgi:hypothetical protein